MYKTYSAMKGKRIWPWPVGIDTHKWSPEMLGSKPTHDFFIYLKGQPAVLKDQIEESLLAKGLTCLRTLEYGRYNESELEELCRRCKFAVLVTDTESQGIAYMQILSAGLPCFVLDKPVWRYQGPANVSAEATSAPYFDDRCGAKIPSRGMVGMDGSDRRAMDLFVKNVGKQLYSPRDYILEGHTLAIGATEYLRLLKRTSGQ